MDDADLAQINEERERDAALASVLANDPGEPVECGGVRCCADCAEQISAQRLAAWPRAIRCTDCQQVFEARNRGRRGR